MQGLAGRGRPADGHAPPAAQARVRLRLQPRRQIDRGRRRRRHDPRLGVRLDRPSPDQPDGPGPVRPRRGDRPARVHPGRLATRHHRRGPDHQSLGRRRLLGASTLGESARRRFGPGDRRRRQVVPRRPDGRINVDLPTSGGSRAEEPRLDDGSPDHRARSRRGRTEEGRGARAEQRRRPGERPGASRDRRRNHRRERQGRSRRRLLPIRGEGRRDLGAGGRGGPRQVEARLLHRGARRPGPTDRTGSASGGPRVVLHLPRQGRRDDRRLPSIQSGRDALE